MKYLPLLLLLIACTTQQTTIQQVDTHLTRDITIEQALNMPDAVILDVRTPEEFNQGHLKGAINMDYKSEDFKEQLFTLDPTKTYIVHCKSGARSDKAVDMMPDFDAHNMIGGYDAWVAANYPTTLS